MPGLARAYRGPPALGRIGRCHGRSDDDRGIFLPSSATLRSMNEPFPKTSTHIPEMVIATVAGVAFGVKTGHYLAGIFIGIVLGVALSVLGSVVRARSRR